ncbi:hypothetical protein MiAbW_01488 [Microcystis aeruginosa NIES-4325]|uniref:Uncharacterized protein n=1 Tax=Microcystis aeruginosa NIES-4325 TaxID=2569534 RepID=A0A5J4F8Q3_MICAE|nr:hypothetical protein [Microcystis aeruginosa]GEA26928.1 hypothetical protein MiAbW_01488 [Microcystis aeruginosa NIES-4325]
MRPMSASELQEIALDIATEVNRLNQLESQMRLVQAAMLTNPTLADICAKSLALKLQLGVLLNPSSVVIFLRLLR